MSKKSQIPPQLIGGIILVVFLVMVIPLLTETFNSISCQKEKGTISNLQNDLSQCSVKLQSEIQKSAIAEVGLSQCKKDFVDCQNNLTSCYDAYNSLKKECEAKEQPKSEFYFIKIFSNKIILFEYFVLYNVHLFGLFLSFGITFTIKLFEVDIEIRLLNKKNQRKLVKIIRDYLAEHPYMPVIIMIALIILTNIPQLLALL